MYRWVQDEKKETPKLSGRKIEVVIK